MVKGLRGETYESKSPMPTHTMTRNTNPARINLLFKGFKDCRGQFFGYVAVHIVPFVVGRECSVDIEPGAGAEVVCVVFALDSKASYNLSALILFEGWGEWGGEGGIRGLVSGYKTAIPFLLAPC